MNILRHTAAWLLAASATVLGTQAWADAPVIKTFTVQQVKALTPGTQLNFKLTGTPDAQVTVSVEGGKHNSITLSETQAGQYAGSYLLGKNDQVTYASKAQATLLAGEQSTQATLVQTLLTASAHKTAEAQAKKAQAVAAAKRPACTTCGTLLAVNEVEVEGKPGYTGAVLGGLAGAALGDSMGRGNGHMVGGVLGAVGGALAGREVEKRLTKEKRYNVVVRLNDGSERTVQMLQAPNVAVGAKVRIDGDKVVAE